MPTLLGELDVHSDVGSHAVSNVLGAAIQLRYRPARLGDFDEIQRWTDDGRLGTDRGDALTLELGQDAVLELLRLFTSGFVIARRPGSRERRGVLHGA